MQNHRNGDPNFTSVFPGEQKMNLKRAILILKAHDILSLLKEHEFTRTILFEEAVEAANHYIDGQIDSLKENGKLEEAILILREIQQTI